MCKYRAFPLGPGTECKPPKSGLFGAARRPRPPVGEWTVVGSQPIMQKNRPTALAALARYDGINEEWNKHVPSGERLQP
jgi:hypothetical protein